MWSGLKHSSGKCLNAYSALPTAHVNQSSHRLPLFPFHLSPSNISLYLAFLSFNTEPRIQSETTNSLSSETTGRRRSHHSAGAGTWCWGWYEASVWCVCNCAHVCSTLGASCLSAKSMKPLLLGSVVVSEMWHGTRLWAFCCSTDGETWRNAEKNYDCHYWQCRGLIYL